MSLGADLESAGTALTFRRRWMTPITVSLLLVALTTVALWLIQPQLKQQHLIFIYLVPTSLVAIRFGSISAMCVTIASSFVAAFLLYAPYFSFLVESPLDLLELALFCMLALLASQVVSGFATDSDVARRRQREHALSIHERWPAMAALWNRFRFR
jgi:two-component system, OmpR family, sensor histidine kinase KdpD